LIEFQPTHTDPPLLPTSAFAQEGQWGRGSRLISRLFGFGTSVLFLVAMILTSVCAEEESDPDAVEVLAPSESEAIELIVAEPMEPEPVLPAEEASPGSATTEDTEVLALPDTELIMADVLSSKAEEVTENSDEESDEELIDLENQDSIVEKKTDPELELVQTILGGVVVKEELIVDGERVAESVVVTILDDTVEIEPELQADEEKVQLDTTMSEPAEESIQADDTDDFEGDVTEESEDLESEIDDESLKDGELQVTVQPTLSASSQATVDTTSMLESADFEEDEDDNDDGSGGGSNGMDYGRSSDGHTEADGTFRVTEYYVTIADFNETTYDLLLDHDLANDYFILVRGSRTGDGKSKPDNDYARVYRVPGGRGDMADSGANNVVSLSRHVADYDWEGVVTIVESLTDTDESGFRLLDVVETSILGEATSGFDNSSTPWSDIRQVVLFGGYRGGGAEFEANVKNSRQGDVVYTRLYPSDADTLSWERVNSSGRTLQDMTMTTFVVEWGRQWQVQHVRVSGTNAGPKANQTKHYTTTMINPVSRQHTWVWGTGTSTGDGIGEDAEATLITLGDGVDQKEMETSVAIGSEMPFQRDFDIYTMTHFDLATDYIFKPDGDQQVLDLNVPTDSAALGASFAWAYGACASASSNHPQCRFWSRYTDDEVVTVSRGYAGKQFAAWVQGIDFSAIRPIVSQGVTVDIVDVDGDSVPNPMVVMDDVSFSFTDETSSGVLGTADQRIRLSNSGLATTWSVSIAPTSGAAALWWDGGANTFDFEDSSAGGQLTVDPSVATISRPDGGSTGGVTLGSAEFFEAGVRNEVLLYSAAGAEPHQGYDLMGVALSQIIPALQVEGDYRLQLTLTVL